MKMHLIVKRWPQLLGVLLLSVAIGACGGDRSRSSAVAESRPAQPDQQDEVAQSGATTVNVVTSEFAITLDSAQLSAGTITFVVQNNGQIPHDFAIQGNGVNQKSALIQPGASGSLTVDLAPGSYSYVCSVPGHAMLGMKGSFTVNKAG
jgi:uncharacterized cupredoxin-like copper-binding protein